MADSDSETKGCCKSSCCKSSCCQCDCSNLKEFIKRRYGRIILVIVGWAMTICVYVYIKDKDWNLAVIPYFIAFVSCALVSTLCDRGRHNYEKYNGSCDSQADRSQHGNLVSRDDSEVSPLLSGASSSATADLPCVRADPRPLEHAEELFEPAPVVFQASNEGASACLRDTQVTVQADVHRPVQDSPSLRILPHKRPVESFSSASGSDPHNSSTTPDSGVALKSTAQLTPSGGPIPRPPPPNTEEPRKDNISPVEKSTRF